MEVLTHATDDLVGTVRILPTAGPAPRDRILKLTTNQAVRATVHAFEATSRHYELARASATSTTLRDTLSFHLAVIADRDLRTQVVQAIRADHLDAPAAIKRVFEGAAQSIARHEGYLGLRAEDFREIRDRIVEHLLVPPVRRPPFRFAEPTILVCDHLTLDLLTRFDPTNVIAVLAAYGNRNAHAAIVLEGEGIPLVIDPTLRATVKTGEILVLPRPDATRERRPLSATEREGLVITPAINSAAEADAEILRHLDGIGLVRTELAVPILAGFPSLSEQTTTYRRILKAVPDKRIRFRLFDVEPDKPSPLPGSSYGARFLATHPAILEDQLNALLDASIQHEVDILVPMAETPEDVAEIARDYARLRALTRTHAPDGKNIRFGVMVESRLAAASLAAFPLVEFVSIGSNDLAADLFDLDREHGDFDATCFQRTEFLDVLRDIVATTRRLGVEATLCGGAADDPDAVRAARGVGIRHFAPSLCGVNGYLCDAIGPRQPSS